MLLSVSVPLELLTVMYGWHRVVLIDTHSSMVAKTHNQALMGYLYLHVCYMTVYA